ncbi:MAG: response regulator [Verrucomicrobia bacterium]|nr:response regulator [Verrucomicrobiota bacterium]
MYLVDDDPLLLEVATLALSGGPWALEAFNTPQAALRRFQAAEARPDLILTDYSMGVMTGLDLVTECQRLDPDLKVIFASATIAADVLPAASVRVARFVPKPYTSQQLRAAVTEVLGVGTET